MKNFFQSRICLSEAHCDACRLQTVEGRQWRESIAKHFSVPGIDFECPRGKPWLKEKPDKPLLSKILKAGSQMIARTMGGEKVTDEQLAQRKEICRACELILIDETGEWCGKLLEMRFGKETKKRKGCGCLLDSKWQRINFDCPRGLWPAII